MNMAWCLANLEINGSKYDSIKGNNAKTGKKVIRK